MVRDFVARGRPLRGQTRLAPLAKRSTCSKCSSGVVKCIAEKCAVDKLISLQIIDANNTATYDFF